MSTKDLVLNIAVNLGRLSKWAAEKRHERIPFFFTETESYLKELENAPRNEKFEPTLQKFKDAFRKLKTDQLKDQSWAEEMLTWANILQHRAKLA